MVESAIPWGDVQAALRSWVSASLTDPTQGPEDAVGGRIAWTGQDALQLNRPFATMSLLSARPVGSALVRRYTVPLLERVTVEAASAQEYSIQLREGHGPDEVVTEISYASPGSEDAGQIRNQLLAQITGDWPWNGPDPDDPASLLLAGTLERPSFSCTPGASLSSETVSEALREHTFEATELALRIQVETDSVQPDSHARSYVARLRSSLGLRSVRRTLRDAFLAVAGVDAPIDLTGVVNGTHVSRVAQDFRFRVGASISGDLPWIRTAEAPVIPVPLAV